MNSFVRDRSGAGALEFALVAPVLIFMIIGIMQIGLALQRGSTVQWAAERAAREVMLDGQFSQGALQAAVEAELVALGDTLPVTVSYTVSPGEVVSIGRVRVDYAYPVILPLVDQFKARFSVDTEVPFPTGG